MASIVPRFTAQPSAVNQDPGNQLAPSCASPAPHFAILPPSLLFESRSFFTLRILRTISNIDRDGINSSKPPGASAERTF